MFINDILTAINDVMYTYILVVLLVGVGIYFTIRTKGVQFRLLGDGIKSMLEKSEKNEMLFEKMNEIFKECGLPAVEKRKSLGGSDAAEVTVSGIPCVDSIAVEGDYIHTPKEFAYISSLAESAKRLASIALLI